MTIWISEQRVAGGAAEERDGIVPNAESGKILAYLLSEMLRRTEFIPSRLLTGHVQSLVQSHPAHTC
jgi:hypothetical protein